jgi:hypothetical protein
VGSEVRYGGSHVLCVELQESSQYKIKSILTSEKDSGSTSLALPIPSDLQGGSTPTALSLAIPSRIVNQQTILTIGNE